MMSGQTATCGKQTTTTLLTANSVPSGLERDGMRDHRSKRLLRQAVNQRRHPLLPPTSSQSLPPHPHTLSAELFYLTSPSVSRRSISVAASGLSPLGPTASSLAKPTAIAGTAGWPSRPVRVAFAIFAVSYLGRMYVMCGWYADRMKNEMYACIFVSIHLILGKPIEEGPDNINGTSLHRSTVEGHDDATNGYSCSNRRRYSW